MGSAYQTRPFGPSCGKRQMIRSQYNRDQTISAIKKPHTTHQVPKPNQNLIGSSRRSLLATPALLWCGCGFCKNASAATPSSNDYTAPGESRNAFLDRVFAENMFTGMHDYEEAIAPVKRSLFSRLKPPDVSSPTSSSSLHVVEIGCGTGPNLKYYPRDQYKDISITAVDPNNFMLPYLYKNMDAQGWDHGGQARQKLYL